MPLLDLSLVTTTLETVVKRRVRSGLVALNQPATVLNALSVSATSPDQLSGDATVGLYLYHTTESATLKNLPPPGQDEPPVRFAPMGLDLYYQLTAHSALSGESGPRMAQRLFGLALKALRDFPVLNRFTLVEGLPAFPTEIQGTDNLFRIVLQVVPVTDASQFWTAGNQPVRLAAYFQVSATLLEPEPPTRFGGRVLRYGVETFVSGAPRLEASRSTIVYRVPGETSDREALVQPAEAPVGGAITFLGNDLTGDITTLVLEHPQFPAPVEVGLDWGVSASGDRVYARVQGQAGGSPMLPGFYTAAARVTRRRRMPDGSLRDFTGTSNKVTWVVTPLLTSPGPTVVGTADANGVFVVQGHIFRHPNLDGSDIKVVVGPLELPRETTGTLQPGHFEVVDGTTLLPPVVLDDTTRPFVIRFRLADGSLAPGDVVPLRVMIRGAENAPRWVLVP